MRTWQLQTARGHFSELFDAALGDGPQRITRHGRQAVVVVAEEEWSRRLAAADDGFGPFLASYPKNAIAVRPRRPARVRRDPPF
jgi:antitoxin Phd